MKKHEINFLQTTTIEHLQEKILSCYGARSEERRVGKEC